MSRIKIGLAIFAILVLPLGCGSKEKPEDKTVQKDQPAGVSGGVQQTATKSTPVRSQSVDAWEESLEDDTFPAVAMPADPDAAIARYSSECPKGSINESCHTLRLQVEQILLHDLVGLRSTGQDIDPQWYRVAAKSETPQLACIGVRELVYAKQRSPEEDAIIVAAADSPARSVRVAALALQSQLPALKEMQPRVRYDSANASGTCLDDDRDPDPGLKWAGGYPNARYRYIASSASIRWFTTTDPVEKVVAYFNSSGRPARTEAEMTAAEQASYLEEARKLSGTQDPNAATKILQLMQKQGRAAAWMQPFKGLMGISEVRMAMIGKDQGIAIFRDDIFHATSIVATVPPKMPDYTPDIEKAKLDQLSRQVLKY
jgi:hypothetical protein